MPDMQFHFPPGGSTMGPYSPAVSIGELVYTSGQIPRDKSGALISNSIEAATQTALENLRDVLASAGCTPGDVLKTTVFMQDLNDFEGMNKTYAAFFGPHRPARSTVQVAKLPANSRVEIECVAVKRK
jgi:2-iminobutanoate/2-iminopropanoate deaminase